MTFNASKFLIDLLGDVQRTLTETNTMGKKFALQFAIAVLVEVQRSIVPSSSALHHLLGFSQLFSYFAQGAIWVEIFELAECGERFVRLAFYAFP